MTALGCFILWFGWYGFNGAAASSVIQLGRIFMTTTLAPSAALIACMLFTWWKNGHPDVAMCLNAVIAGLQTDYVDNYLMHMLPDVHIWMR